jgi:hypothetical protein
METPLHVLSKASPHFTVCGLHVVKHPMFIDNPDPVPVDVCIICNRAKQGAKRLYINHNSTFKAL